MGDDGVGIRIVRILKENLQQSPDLEFKELSVGGLRMVEEMLGYENVFVVDSITRKDSEVGTISEFDAEQVSDPSQFCSTHVTGFQTALELYKMFDPSKVPKRIKIFTVGIEPDFTFKESLSAPVKEAAAKLADLVRIRLSELT
jgi:hydrogenase maturation protease